MIATAAQPVFRWAAAWARRRRGGMMADFALRLSANAGARVERGGAYGFRCEHDIVTKTLRNPHLNYLDIHRFRNVILVRGSLRQPNGLRIPESTLMKLSRTAVRAGVARRPTTVGARRATVVGTVLALAGMAYVFWSAATDSGIVGWFNARQARGSGRYDETLSFMLSMFCVMIPAYAVALPLARLGRSARLPVRTANPPEMLATHSKTALLVGLGMIIAIWAGGFGIYEYYTLRTQQEMHATYEPVDVGAPVGAASGLRFVALRGKVHPNGYMKRTENHNHTGTSFIPLVATTARDPAVPVHWFVRADGEPYLPATIYGDATGETLPRTVREAFERNGTNIAPDAVLVSFVATDSTGRVLDDSGENFLFFVGGCGAASLVTLAMVAALWLKLRAQRRRLTAV